MVRELYHIEVKKEKGFYVADLWVSEILEMELDDVTIMGTIKSDSFWYLILKIAKKGWIKHL